MNRGVLIAADDDLGSELKRSLEQHNLTVTDLVDTDRLERCTQDRERLAQLSAGADTIVLQGRPRTLTTTLITLCDSLGIRILALCADESMCRFAQAHGVGALLAAQTSVQQIAEAIHAPLSERLAPLPSVDKTSASVMSVWGPTGSPGRSTLAREIASVLAEKNRRVGLVDADAHAPSLALSLGIDDDIPGFAAACRQAELGGLDNGELNRVSIPVRVGRNQLAVLTGINRPSRWPELSEKRVRTTLEACRNWADYTVVDVGACLERDEEIVSDIFDGPRRNAATLAALASSDHIVAVLSADPVGVARFVRAFSELREAVGDTPITVVANRLRAPALGVDAKAQIHTALNRFLGITDVSFLPADFRASDAALLACTPITVRSPRCALSQGIRRLVDQHVYSTTLAA